MKGRSYGNLQDPVTKVHQKTAGKGGVTLGEGSIPRFSLLHPFLKKHAVHVTNLRQLTTALAGVCSVSEDYWRRWWGGSPIRNSGPVLVLHHHLCLMVLPQEVTWTLES